MSFGFWLRTAVGLIAITQILRWFILEYEFPIFLNDKFAFSLDIPIWISYVMYLIVFFFITRYIKQNWFELGNGSKVGLALIVCGGLSNFIERLLVGHVVDYIFISTGVLNLADFYIFVGVGVLLIFRSHHH